MVRILRGKVFYSALFIWSLFFPAMYLLSKTDLFNLIGTLVFTTSVAVLHAYWPAMRITLFRPRIELEYVDLLTLGIMCTWFALAANMAFAVFLYNYYGGQPSELPSYFVGFLRYVTFTGGILHLSARRVLRNSVPTTSLPRIVASVSIGLAFGIVLSILY